jgi:type II restriction/modification system DNA methylase subunit YeeA
MKDRSKKIQEFQEWVRKYITGDEKGESHVFLERLYQACGYEGYKEAGATFEYRVRRKGQSTKFADLVWGSRLLLEMKKRGEKLAKHRDQIFDYWLGLTPNRPQFVILCNFDEFWIYDFNTQIEAPVDIVLLGQLEERYQAISFFFPEQEKPVFEHDLVEVTREAADNVAQVLNSLIRRGEKTGDFDRATAQRFILQCVFALFAEDIDLLPRAFFTRLLKECLDNGASSFDLLGGLFRQMDRHPVKAGRYKGIEHFNGGLFRVEAPIELNADELSLLYEAAKQNWKKVQPAIFGTIFEDSVLEPSRHAFGAHYTHEADIAKVIIPTIEKPWRERIESATFEELKDMRDELAKFRILDPACGSGNFLYVAYRYLKRIEADLLNKLWSYKSREAAAIPIISRVSTKQFFGIDINPFAVELAKVTMVIAKKLALDEFYERLDKKREYKKEEGSVGTTQLGLRLELDEALPLDNLDENFWVEDAILNKWPKADAIIGNPPYQSLNKAEKELLKAAQEAYPEVPKRADYCVYWFRRAHDLLPKGGRAGLIGTNSIRQTTSREASLDYIIKNGGIITEAVSSQVWPGDAVVHVSIVNWVKGKQVGKKTLYVQNGDQVESPWDKAELDEIHGGLSMEIDLSAAFALRANGAHAPIDERLTCQGQTHDHEGFLLSPKEAKEIAKDKSSTNVLRPYLIGNDLLGQQGGLPSRYAIDLNECEDLTAAQRHKSALEHLIQAGVLKTAEDKAHKQILEKCEQFMSSVRKSKAPPMVLAGLEQAVASYTRGKGSVNDRFATLIAQVKSLNSKHELGLDASIKALAKPGDRYTHLQKWWHYWRDRYAFISRIEAQSRYVVCSRHLRRPVFEFIDPLIRPNDALQCFAFEDDYSFGVLQSHAHALWFTERSGSIKRDSRYTPTKAFASFPWPQKPTLEEARTVAWAAVRLRTLRTDLMQANHWNFRQLYETYDLPGKNDLREAHAELDNAVRAAYGMTLDEDPLSFLLDLNARLHELEEKGKFVQGPGLPAAVKKPDSFITQDRIQMIDAVGLRVLKRKA